jgi:hypothetical protein
MVPKMIIGGVIFIAGSIYNPRRNRLRFVTSGAGISIIRI